MSSAFMHLPFAQRISCSTTYCSRQTDSKSCLFSVLSMHWTSRQDKGRIIEACVPQRVAQRKPLCTSPCRVGGLVHLSGALPRARLLEAGSGLYHARPPLTRSEVRVLAPLGHPTRHCSLHVPERLR